MSALDEDKIEKSCEKDGEVLWWLVSWKLETSRALSLSYRESFILS